MAVAAEVQLVLRDPAHMSAHGLPLWATRLCQCHHLPLQLALGQVLAVQRK